MKKLILIILIFLSVASYAQDGHYIYCEIVGTQKMLSKKISIEVDFGQMAKLTKSQRLVDEEGQPIIFNSMVDAMNFFGAKGWEFVQAYAVTIQGQNVYHWLLKLNIDNMTEEELEAVKEVLYTRQMFKEEQKGQN